MAARRDILWWGELSPTSRNASQPSPTILPPVVSRRCSLPEAKPRSHGHICQEAISSPPSPTPTASPPLGLTTPITSCSRSATQHRPTSFRSTTTPTMPPAVVSPVGRQAAHSRKMTRLHTPTTIVVNLQMPLRRLIPTTATHTTLMILAIARRRRSVARIPSTRQISSTSTPPLTISHLSSMTTGIRLSSKPPLASGPSPTTAKTAQLFGRTFPQTHPLPTPPLPHSSQCPTTAWAGA